MNNVLLVSIFALIGIVFWILIACAMKIWPFNTKEPKDKSKSRGLSQANTTQSESGSGTIVGISLFFIFILFFVAIVFISFKMTMTRYKIAGEAIKQGNTAVATAIMAPEIGYGVNSGLTGIRNIFRK
jgi:uncharacterized membrane protein